MRWKCVTNFLESNRCASPLGAEQQSRSLGQVQLVVSAVVAQQTVKQGLWFARKWVSWCYIEMRPRGSSGVGFAVAACGFAVCYIAYGLTHPPQARAFHYQGVNTIRNISIVLTNNDSQREVFPVRTKK
jgi:hypothetical protein